MRAIGYTRVSSVEQLNGTSLTEQRKMIQAFCAMKDIELVETFTDAAVSGGKALRDRPEGSKMLQSLRDGEADTVIICKLDRGFRSASDCLATVEAWEKQGIALVILNLGGQTIDTSSAAGKFFITVMAGAAELEKNLIRERTASGRAARKKEGKSIGGVPFGFKKDPDNFLLPNEHEQEVIGIVKTLKLEGMSARQIANQLNDRGIKSKKGRTWQATQIIRILEAA